MEAVAANPIEQGIVSDLFEKLIQPAAPKKVAKVGLVGIGLEEHFDWASIKKNYRVAQENLQLALPNEYFQLTCTSEPIQTKEDILAWLQSQEKEGVDAIVVYQGSYIAGDLAATLARWLVQHLVPVLSWSHDEATGGRLVNNRLCGQNFLLNILSSSKVKYSWLFENPKSENLKELIMPFAKAVYAKASMNQRMIGMVGGFRVPGFYDCELNEIALLERYGLIVDRVDFETIWKHGQKFKESDIDEIREKLLYHPACKFNNVTPEQINKSLRLSLAVADYSRQQNYIGIGLKNWPELFDHYGIAGDGAGALIQDIGIPVADESDMGALLTMVVMNQVTLTEGLPTLVDLSLIDQGNNRIGFWHCGGAPTKLINEPTGFEVRNHSILENFSVESSMGMLLEFMQKTGPVTIAKYQYPDGARVFNFEGEILPSEMAFRGSYAEVRPEIHESKDVLSAVLNNGCDHHWIIGRGHFLKDLDTLNHWLGVNQIDIPKSLDHLYGHSL
ncbi:hypothetical protein KMW28_18165 [Flammeovirga yaeyamensis]|uniref:L-fucose isomerase n=1 Tax=Flammeovirga yaeyamensis TaxID=367791 RepID=A0AAX1N255_9BACT|nr:hypothetical protein [Flammeovirga yaeyamensis]MBB3701093.1 L-fucose isomerase-like protein [Flammeovirga yaeyamensis]NMF38440.1 hypothetical protein [Flammeovirga yaeyamensis]QWG01561.1 hypothetical protein KMW28_18165 [Flammeovirga yaeyamensis]